PVALSPRSSGWLQPGGEQDRRRGARLRKTGVELSGETEAPAMGRKRLGDDQSPRPGGSPPPNVPIRNATRRSSIRSSPGSRASRDRATGRRRSADGAAGG